jgi:hypothetical protein
VQRGDHELDRHERGVVSEKLVSMPELTQQSAADTLRWSSNSTPELAWSAGAPSEGAGIAVGGRWKASELGKPFSKPEK